MPHDEPTDTIRLVLDGTPYAGKTTAAHTLAESLGQAVSTPAPGDDERTRWFDWLEYTGGRHNGRPIRVEVVTVPGQEHLSHRRRQLLAWGDVVVFVVDSAPEAFQDQIRSFARLRADLVEIGERPLVVIANKRDLDGAVPIPRLREEMGIDEATPLVEAVATSGVGIRHAFVFGVRAALAGDRRSGRSSPDELLALMEDAEQEPSTIDGDIDDTAQTTETTETTADVIGREFETDLAAAAETGVDDQPDTVVRSDAGADVHETETATETESETETDIEIAAEHGFDATEQLHAAPAVVGDHDAGVGEDPTETTEAVEALAVEPSDEVQDGTGAAPDAHDELAIRPLVLDTPAADSRTFDADTTDTETDTDTDTGTSSFDTATAHTHSFDTHTDTADTHTFDAGTDADTVADIPKTHTFDAGTSHTMGAGTGIGADAQVAAASGSGAMPTSGDDQHQGTAPAQDVPLPPRRWRSWPLLRLLVASPADESVAATDSVLESAETVADNDETPELIGATETVEQIEAVETVEQIEAVETVQEIEAIEQIEQFEAVQEIDEVEQFEAVQEIDEVDQIEAVETVQEIEAIEQIEAIEAVEEIEQIDEVEQIEQIEAFEISDVDELVGIEEIDVDLLDETVETVDVDTHELDDELAIAHLDEGFDTDEPVDDEPPSDGPWLDGVGHLPLRSPGSTPTAGPLVVAVAPKPSAVEITAIEAGRDNGRLPARPKLAASAADDDCDVVLNPDEWRVLAEWLHSGGVAPGDGAAIAHRLLERGVVTDGNRQAVSVGAALASELNERVAEDNERYEALRQLMKEFRS